MKKNLLFVWCFLMGGLLINAQNRLVEDLEYSVSAQTAASTSKDAPFWFTANRYGSASAKQYSASLRASLMRPIEHDSLRRWRLGYGLDLIGGYGLQGKFNVQQAFVDVQYKNARLSFGSKERPVEFRNNELSSGGMTFSNNAVPIPQVRFELPRWWNISGKSRMVFIKGHIAYGMCTDGRWQERNNGGDTRFLYAKNTLYHSKAGYIKIGNEERFPLVASGGLEMASQFGGTVYNMTGYGGAISVDGDHTYGYGSRNVMPHNAKAFLDAFIPGGADPNDGDYSNVGGNQLGSWQLNLGWYAKNWSVKAYMEHFFEDHSMMFWQYVWKDNLLGLEVNLPANRFVSSAVFEYIGTMDQSGSIYHDKTANLPIGLYGRDNYYLHHLYGGYQHWGFLQGNPLLISPLYNDNGLLEPLASRQRSFHAGLSGDPHPDLHWRMLFTHVRGLGSYVRPSGNPEHGTFFLAEVSYKPHQLKDWQFMLSVGTNAGQMLKTSQGVMLTVSKCGLLNRSNKK